MYDMLCIQFLKQQIESHEDSRFAWRITRWPSFILLGIIALVVFSNFSSALASHTFKSWRILWFVLGLFGFWIGASLMLFLFAYFGKKASRKYPAVLFLFLPLPLTLITLAILGTIADMFPVQGMEWLVLFVAIAFFVIIFIPSNVIVWRRVIAEYRRALSQRMTEELPRLRRNAMFVVVIFVTLCVAFIVWGIMLMQARRQVYQLLGEQGQQMYQLQIARTHRIRSVEGRFVVSDNGEPYYEGEVLLSDGIPGEYTYVISATAERAQAPGGPPVRSILKQKTVVLPQEESNIPFSIAVGDLVKKLVQNNMTTENTRTSFEFSLTMDIAMRLVRDDEGFLTGGIPADSRQNIKQDSIFVVWDYGNIEFLTVPPPPQDFGDDPKQRRKYAPGTPVCGNGICESGEDDCGSGTFCADKNDPSTCRTSNSCQPPYCPQDCQDTKSDQSPVKPCRPTGCSNQICSDEPVNTTCEWKEEYDCYRKAVCERQTDGECGWRQTPELKACL